MENSQSKIWIRVNGIGHAFSREISCDCKRCQTINFAMAESTGRLEEFAGWDDPPWRAHTSASILIPDTKDLPNVGSHILIDAGAGVGDSLVCSKLEGLDNIKGILISHWHPDHVLALNQICESLQRKAKRKGSEFVKVPVYCTLATYDRLREKRGFSYEFNRRLCFHEILPGIPFKVQETPPLTIIALEVAHSGIEGAVIYVAEIGSKKVVYSWDIDVPDAQRSSDKKKNIEVIRENQNILSNAVLLFMAANTWEAEGTGHTSYIRAREYIRAIRAEQTYLVHLSGHEDRQGNEGYGWIDSQWEAAVNQDGVSIVRQGMLIGI